MTDKLMGWLADWITKQVVDGSKEYYFRYQVNDINIDTNVTVQYSAVLMPHLAAIDIVLFEISRLHLIWLSVLRFILWLDFSTRINFLVSFRVIYYKVFQDWDASILLPDGFLLRWNQENILRESSFIHSILFILSTPSSSLD